MRPGDDDPYPETRADVARRRLAQLAASFEDGREADPPAPASHGGPEPSAGRRRATGRRRIGAAHVRVLATVGAAAGVLLTWWLLAERPRTADVDGTDTLTVARADASEPAQDAPPGAAADDGQVVVDVAGRVRRPGIVTLPAGSRVHEAVEAAGGIEGRIDGATLNLARKLVDGEQILVGIDPAPAAPGRPGGPGASGGGLVNLNSATAEQLDALPGVGPVTAQAILDWRAENGGFSAVEDLLDVSGIGDKTFADLRDLVTV